MLVMSKYEPLPRFLGSVGGAAHRMSFGEIERILGFKLPNSAYQHEAWWSNNATGHSHARAWLQSGWRTEAIDLAARKVTFQRRDDLPDDSSTISPEPLLICSSEACSDVKIDSSGNISDSKATGGSFGHKACLC